MTNIQAPHRDMAEINYAHYSRLYDSAGALKAYEVRDKVQILLSYRAMRSLRGGKIIDLGFGSGSLALALLARGACVWGVENVDSALSALSERVAGEARQRLHLVRASVDALPADIGGFDVAVCSHVLEHVDNDAGVVSEMRRVLKPGGVGMILVPGTQDESPLHCRNYSRQSLRALVECPDVDVLEVRGYGNWLTPFHCHARHFAYVAISRLCGRAPRACTPAADGAECEGNRLSDKPTLLQKVYWSVVVPVLLLADRVDMWLPAGKNSKQYLAVFRRKP